MPEDSMVNLLNTHLPSLEKIEGDSIEEFMRKSKNNEQEFAYTEKDGDTDRNKKDTLKLIFNPERFYMQKMCNLNDVEALTDSEKIVQFVKASINGE